MKLKITLLLLMVAAVAQGQLQPDSSFSQDGYHLSNSSSTEYGRKMIELDNGDLLVAGTRFVNGKNNLSVWKFKPNGSLNQSFGVNGYAENSLTTIRTFTMQDIAIQGDGKILLLTTHTIPNADANLRVNLIALIRFNSDGSVDNSFGTNGYILSRPDTAYTYTPFSLAVDPNTPASFYVSSQAVENGHATCPLGFGKWCLSKYKNDGSLDNGFNNSGYILDDADELRQATTTSPVAHINDIRVMPDGKLVGGGALFVLDQGYFTFRMLPNGQWDNTYGTNGRSYHSPGYSTPATIISQSKVLPNGRVVLNTIARYQHMGSDSTVIQAIKCDETGTQMTNFGSNGVLTYSYPSEQYQTFAFRQDESFVISWYRKNGSNDQKVEFAHFNPTGQLDLSFGNNGRLSTQLMTLDLYSNASVVFDILWSRDETRLFGAFSKQQPPSNIPEQAVFSYKWAGASPLNVKEPFLGAKPSIYPNPSQSQLQLVLPNGDSSSDIKIYSVNGALVLQLPFKETIDVSSLLSGVYFMSLDGYAPVTFMKK